jgi:hypothetical protein
LASTRPPTGLSRNRYFPAAPAARPCGIRICAYISH